MGNAADFGPRENGHEDHRLVVIGGSTGAFEALKTIVATLPRELAATVLIVTHIGKSRSMLAELLQVYCPLPVSQAFDGEALTNGKVLLAPPDNHLIVRPGVVRLHHSAKENYSRPAID